MEPGLKERASAFNVQQAFSPRVQQLLSCCTLGFALEDSFLLIRDEGSGCQPESGLRPSSGWIEGRSGV